VIRSGTTSLFGRRKAVAPRWLIRRWKQNHAFAVILAVEDWMPVAIALILGVVLIAVCLLGFLWTLIFLVPFYAWIAAAAYLMWRSKRAENTLAASVEREAEQQRHFNEQEMRAWRASIEIERRNDTRRNKVLRSLDRSREPPPEK
jgi:uncharacterized protein (DUF58 family)